MKLMKKILAFAMAALMLLGLCGCGMFELAVARAASNMAELESVHMDLVMEMETEMSIMGQSQAIDMRLDMGMDVQTQPTTMMKLEGTVEMLGMEQNIISYMEQNGEAVDCYMSIDGTNWEMGSLEGDSAPTLEGAFASIDVLAESAKSFEKAGKEEIMGSTATRYDGKISGDSIKEIMSATDVYGMTDDSMGTFLNELSPDMGVPTSVWIDDENGMISRFEIDMTELMKLMADEIVAQAKEEAGEEEIEVDMVIGKVVISATYSQFDSIEPIEIPAEAKG